MKRSLLFIFTLCFLGQQARSQIVTSECTPSDSLLDKYMEDAQRLALYRIFQTGSPYRDSVEIPGSWTDSMLAALTAIYNAQEIPARDTVIRMLRIKTFPLVRPEGVPGFTLHQLDFTAYKVMPWMVDLRHDVFPTRDTLLNRLMTLYNLKKHQFIDLSSQSLGLISLITPSSYNMYAMGRRFARLNTLKLLGDGIAGDGPDIRIDKVTASYIQLSYIYSWGDCLSGCTWSRRWSFRVYHNDCLVEYMGSYGHSLTSPGAANIITH